MGALMGLFKSVHSTTGVHPKVQAASIVATILWAGSSAMEATGHLPSPAVKAIAGPLLTFAAGWLTPSPTPIEPAILR